MVESKIIDVNKILFRASGNGNLMSASGKWTETNKKYLAQVFIKEKYNRDKTLENKYINNGLAVEEDSIALYSYYKQKEFVKNDEYFKNDYIKGTPDILEDEPVIDIKSSYSIHTFFETKHGNTINDMYDWQMQSYMALTGKSRAVLAYCLTDMPEVIMQGELRRLMYKMGVATDEDPQYIAAAEAFRLEHTFGDLPLEERIFEIQIKRDQKKIMDLYARIIEGRKLIKDMFL